MASELHLASESKQCSASRWVAERELIGRPTATAHCQEIRMQMQALGFEAGTGAVTEPTSEKDARSLWPGPAPASNFSPYTFIYIYRSPTSRCKSKNVPLAETLAEQQERLNSAWQGPGDTGSHGCDRRHREIASRARAKESVGLRHSSV